MITVTDLSLSYSGTPLFSHVDLQFLRGNCYGIIGANGAGKSTFLKILSGDLDSTSGEVSILPNTRMSVLKQDQNAYDAYNVMDTVIMGNQRLYDIGKQKEALYAKEEMTDEDGMLACQLEEEYAELGGWEAESTVDYFKRYAVKVVEALGDELHYICTINEANMGLQIAAISKRYMMQMQKAAAARAAAGQAESSVQMGMNLQKMLENRKAAAAESLALFGTENPQTFQTQRTPEGDLLIMRAHAAARDAIKAICPELKVGLTLSLHDLQPEPGCEALAAKEWDEEFTHYLPYIQNDDFLGVQNYTRTRIGPDGQLPMPEGAELTQMGYEFYPQALANVLRAVAKDFHGDLLITENGIGTGDDTRRVEFIRQALAGVQDCLAESLPIKGYLHWSLLDNFEWQKGFSMTFGLIAVDRANGQTRHPKPSLAFLGSYAAD